MIQLQHFNNEETWININGVLQDSLTDETTLDESYDNAIIKARNTNAGFSEPFTKYKVFDGNEDRYYIGTEEVTRIQNSKYYLHTYKLTEPSKILERYKLSGLSVTQTNEKKSLLFVINRALKDVNTRYNKAFAIFPNEKLDNVLQQDCPEFAVTKKTTLFEFLYNYIGKFINAMPRLLGDKNGRFNSITFDFFEDLNVLSDSINETSLEYSKSEENASTYLETEVSNLVVENADNEGSITYPSPNDWITPRSDSVRLTNDNATMVLPYDIKNIIKVEIYLENYKPKVTIYDSSTVAGERTGNLSNAITGSFDITNNIITEKEWLALEEIKTTTWQTTSNYKNNTLYYSVGSNAIQNLSNTYKSTVFSDEYVISYLVASAFYNKYNNTNVQIIAESSGSQGTLNTYTGKLKYVSVENFNPKNLKYRITYIPYIDTVTAQINPYGIEKGSLTYNQSAETVNAQTLGESMWLELQNQNTTTYQKTARYDDISEIKTVGNIVDGKIITNVLRAFTGSKWINVLYKSNEDFIRKSQYIQENREYRPYLIPATTIVDRHIHTDEYCYVGYSNISNGISFRNDFVNSFVEKKQEITNVEVKTYLSKLGGYSIISASFLPASSIALGHSVQFDWSFVDNFSAGKFIENPENSTPTIRESEYSRKGIFTDFSVSLNPSFDTVLDANRLPEISGNMISSYYTRLYDLDKDAGEKISGSIQLHFLPKQADIIIANNLAKDCPLISNKNYSFVFAFTNEKLNKYSNSLKENYITVGMTKQLNTIEDEYGNEKSAVKIIPNSKPEGYDYWALIKQNADGTNYLYCAGLSKNINDAIYFSFISSGGESTYIPKLIYELSSDETYYTVTGIEINVGDSLDIKIPNTYKNLPVKSIGKSAFENTTITSIEIPENIETISPRAFWHCYNLSKIDFYAKNCSLAPNADEIFFNAGRDTEEGIIVYIRNTVEKVPNYLCKNADYVQKVIISGAPGCVIGYEAFASCNNLNDLTLSDNIEKIASFAFNSTLIESITIPKSVKELGVASFGSAIEFNYKYNGKYIADWNSLLRETTTDGTLGELRIISRFPYTVYINATPNWEDRNVNASELLIPSIQEDGQAVTTVPYGAYQNNTSIKSVTIGEGITSINENAFYGCINLEEIIIPKSVTNIGIASFYNCPKLKRVYYGGNGSQWVDLIRITYDETTQTSKSDTGLKPSEIEMSYTSDRGNFITN